MAIADLVSTLVSQLGIQESQAKGGAGLIFSQIKESLGGDFSKVASALPGVNDLISAAPQAGGIAKLAGGLMGALGGDKAAGLGSLASLASGFSQLKLDPGMISRFVPIVLGFAQNQGGQQVADLVRKVVG